MSGLLDDLPSRGLLLSSRPGLTPCAAKVYVPTSPTAPPVGQSVARDDAHVLVRALERKKAAAAAAGKAKGGPGGGTSEAAAKRAKLAAELEAAPPLTESSVRGLTLAQLKAACSTRGLGVSGKK
jgi:hypothetical protein